MRNHPKIICLERLLTPALVGVAVTCATTVITLNLFSSASHVAGEGASATDPALEEGVKRLLVQIVRALLLEHKIAAADAPGTSPRLRTRSAAPRAAVGDASKRELHSDDVVDTGNFGRGGRC